MSNMKEIKIIIDEETNTTTVKLTGEFTKVKFIGYLEMAKYQAMISKPSDEQNVQECDATKAK